jgi:hypothetical protein
MIMSPFVLDIKYTKDLHHLLSGFQKLSDTDKNVGTIAVLNTCSAECRTAGILLNAAVFL